MANFTEETSLYEILFRISPDHSWAAHYQVLTEVKRDDVTISATLSDVAPLSLDNSEAMHVVTQLISDEAVRLMADNASLRQQVYGLGDLVSDKQQEIDDLRQRLRELEQPSQEVTPL